MTDETPNDVTRRNFIKGVIAAGAAVSSAAYVFRGNPLRGQGAAPGSVERLLTLRVNGSGVPTPLANRIQRFLGGIDHGVERASRGTVDLRVLVPVALFCAGLAILSTSGTLPVPTWYDLMWASFVTFVALNQVAGREGTLSREPDNHS